MGVSAVCRGYQVWILAEENKEGRGEEEQSPSSVKACLTLASWGYGDRGVSNRPGGQGFCLLVPVGPHPTPAPVEDLHLVLQVEVKILRRTNSRRHK